MELEENSVESVKKDDTKKLLTFKEFKDTQLKGRKVSNIFKSPLFIASVFLIILKLSKVLSLPWFFVLFPFMLEIVMVIAIFVCIHILYAAYKEDNQINDIPDDRQHND